VRGGERDRAAAGHVPPRQDHFMAGRLFHPTELLYRAEPAAEDACSTPSSPRTP
jgi:hypothetical protein